MKSYRIDAFSWTLFMLISSINRVTTGADSCPAKKFTLIKDHTACLKTKSPKANLNHRGVTETDAATILNKHNEVRASVAGAVGMQRMVWDEELADMAQKWADNCDFAHEAPGTRRSVPGRYYVGQNIGSRVGKSWSGTLGQWLAEKDLFNYGLKDGMKFVDVGHYTQMVWANSTRLGCGYTRCSGLNDFYVCNYAPAGNGGDWSKPYERRPGPRCSSCPGKCDSLGLCDCKGITCYNDGTLDLNTCTCQCHFSFHSPAQYCALNCTGTKDFWSCGTSCKTNSAHYCPHVCQICPYAAFDYKEPGAGGGVCLSVHVVLLAAVTSLIWIKNFPAGLV